MSKLTIQQEKRAREEEERMERTPQRENEGILNK